MMKQVLVIIIVIAIIFMGRSIMDNREPDTKDTIYKKISAEDAKVIINSEDVIILDVRTQEEYDGGHIENAVISSAINYYADSLHLISLQVLSL